MSKPSAEQRRAAESLRNLAFRCVHEVENFNSDCKHNISLAGTAGMTAIPIREQFENIAQIAELLTEFDDVVRRWPEFANLDLSGCNLIEDMRHYLTVLQSR